MVRKITPQSHSKEILLIGLMITMSVILGFMVHNIYDEWKLNEVSQEKIVDYDQCNNLNLEDTSNCLRNYISTFYNYTTRSDKERTIEDIKENGGDCYDYNKLYERLGKELGFDTYSYRIALGDSFHRVALISDETGYCLLDQLWEINCFKVDNE